MTARWSEATSRSGGFSSGSTSWSRRRSTFGSASVQDFYKFHGTNRQTFAKYYNRYRQTCADEALLPLKRGPKWKSRRTLPFIEEKVLEQRRKGINRYEIYAILKPTLLSHTPSPSTIYAITKRHGLNRLTKEMQTTKRSKTRPGSWATWTPTT